jgi:hypothetical protein
MTDDAPALFSLARSRPGMIERAVSASISAATRSGSIRPADAGAATAARYTARALDAEALRGIDAYRWAALIRELRALLADLRLTPASSGEQHDADPAALLTLLRS